MIVRSIITIPDTTTIGDLESIEELLRGYGRISTEGARYPSEIRFEWDTADASDGDAESVAVDVAYESLLVAMREQGEDVDQLPFDREHLVDAMRTAAGVSAVWQTILSELSSYGIDEITEPGEVA